MNSHSARASHSWVAAQGLGLGASNALLRAFAECFDEARMANGHADNSSSYTEGEQQVLDRAKVVHQETTASARRALKTAERTRDVAANTLDELHTQGDKLVVIEHDLHEIDADAKEAKGILRYMKRCCLCFLCSCCCDFDSSAKLDRTRKQRVKGRDQERRQVRDVIAKRQEREATVIPADARAPVSEGVTRIELFGIKSPPQAAAYEIGAGLREADRQQFLNETQRQEQILDRMEGVIGDIHHMSLQMGEELGRQDEHVSRLTNHVEKTGDNVQTMTQDAKRHWKV